MTEFSKNQLLKQLDDIFQIVTLVYASITYFYRDVDFRILSQNNAVYHEKLFRFQDLAIELQNPTIRAQRLQEFSWSVEKFLLREPYTTLTEYCRINHLEAELTQQDWNKFAQIIRNYVTHNYMDPKSNPPKWFPIIWKNNKITYQEIQESRIDFNKFTKSMPMDLFDEMYEFAKKLPETN